MKFIQVGIIILSPIIISCGGKSSKSGDKSAENTDSISADTIIEEPSAPAFLPDTMYTSAEKVVFRVDTFMKDANSILESTADMYAHAPGSFTFRNGLYRQANFGGKLKGTPSEITVDWKFETSSNKVWGGGSGWTGQPLYVEWPDSCIAKFKANNVVKEDFGKREIMIGSLCGKVYFINFDTGKASRDSIFVDNPIKGTMSLDPTLNGNLYVGHGVPDTIPFGALTINLYKGKISHTFSRDPKAWRNWQAYDSSPLRMGQFLFRPGENGTLYKWLISADGTPALHSTLRYKVNGAAPGIESSMAIYANYGYTADNHGNILCVNLNTMRPVWCYRLGDDIDSSIVLEVEDGHPYIYTGCEIDKQREGDGKFVKLDALNGEEKWILKIPGKRYNTEDKHFDGGFYCTALPGVGNCKDVLFANVVLNTDGQNGEFIAIEKSNGKIKYSKRLKFYAWSSPVGFTNEKNEMFVVTADCAGFIYLINGIDGNIIYSTRIGSNFESSPVVAGNQLVVGSRGNAIYKMTVK